MMQTELERIIEFRRHVSRLGATDTLDVQPIASPVVRLTVADVAVVAPPADLADSVIWHDRHADWAYRRTGSAGVDAYLGWRSTWETSHTLGSISMLRQLDTSMRRMGVELDGVASAAMDRLLNGDLDHFDVRLSIDELHAFSSAVREFTAAVRTDGGLGVALVESSPTAERTGLLRAWPPNPRDSELASRGTVTVRFSGPRIGVWFADDRESIDDVRSFELGIDGAVVVDAQGTAHVLDHDATDALCSVAPDTTAWRVRRVPEVLVWADLLATLETVCDDVRASGSAPRVRLGDERHVALSAID